jgi:hypothetical protein
MTAKADEKMKPVMVPESLHLDLKVKAAREGKKLRDIVIPALRAAVELIAA